MAIGPEHTSPDAKARSERLESLEHLGAFAEGDFFPLRQKRIKRLVAATDDFIVFLNDEDEVEWSHGEMELPEQHGAVASEVTALEALSSVLVGKKRLAGFRYDLAMALTRSFDGHVETARENLASARQVLRERVRFLYASGSFCAALLAATIGLLLWIYEDRLQIVLGQPMLEVLLAGIAGASGALVSVLLERDHRIVAHTQFMYFYDGASRILLGVLGALLIVVAIKANLIAGFLNIQEFGVLVAVGALSGSVERLVPHLIDRTGVPGAGKTAANQGAGAGADK